MDFKILFFLKYIYIAYKVEIISFKSKLYYYLYERKIGLNIILFSINDKLFYFLFYLTYISIIKE